MKVHQIDRKLDRQQDGLTDIWKGDGQIANQIHRRACRWTDSRTNRQTDGQMFGQ